MNGGMSKDQIRSYIIDNQEEEIRRIALELHEGVGQNLYSILTGLQLIDSVSGEPAVKNQVKGMSLLIEKTIQEIRLLSVELHPPALTTLGLLPGMNSYIKLYTSTFGIVVDLETTGVETFITETSRIAVFRVCQEALANIAKFADTTHVKIHFQWEEDHLLIQIHDFGRGFELDKLEENQLSGIVAMKERMLLSGGSCHISSKIGEGTSVEISLPL